MQHCVWTVPYSYIHVEMLFKNPFFLHILCREPLNTDIVGHQKTDAMEKTACPISCRIGPSTTFVRYRKELDDPRKTAEVKRQRDSPFKLTRTGRIMSQSSGKQAMLLNICVMQYQAILVQLKLVKLLEMLLHNIISL